MILHLHVSLVYTMNESYANKMMPSSSHIKTDSSHCVILSSAAAAETAHNEY